MVHIVSGLHVQAKRGAGQFMQTVPNRLIKKQLLMEIQSDTA